MNPEILQMILAMYGSKGGTTGSPGAPAAGASSPNSLAANFSSVGSPQENRLLLQPSAKELMADPQSGQLSLQPSSAELFPKQQPGQMKLPPSTMEQAQALNIPQAQPSAQEAKVQVPANAKHADPAAIAGGLSELNTRPGQIPQGTRGMPMHKMSLADQFSMLQNSSYDGYGGY